MRSQLRAARSRQRAARRAIGVLLRSHHLAWSLTAAQEQKGISRALSALARHGVSQTRLEGVVGVGLAATPLDVLAALSR